MEVKNEEKREPLEAAREMLRGIIALSDYAREDGIILPFNETCLNEYDTSKNHTAGHIMDAAEDGSKRAKMLPFLINLFKNMSADAKQTFGLNAQNDMEYLEFIRNSTTFNTGLHVNLDLSGVSMNGKPLLQEVDEPNGSRRYVATDFQRVMLLEKVLYAISPLFITHTAVSPYVPITALPEEGGGAEKK